MNIAIHQVLRMSDIDIDAAYITSRSTEQFNFHLQSPFITIMKVLPIAAYVHNKKTFMMLELSVRSTQSTLATQRKTGAQDLEGAYMLQQV